MAGDTQILQVELQAMTSAFEKSMARSAQQMQQFGKTAKTVESQLGGFQGALLKLNVAFGAFTAGKALVDTVKNFATSFVEAQDYTDKLTQSLGVMFDDLPRGVDMFDRLKKMSVEVGAPIEQVTDSVRTMIPILNEMGKSNAEIAQFTETMLKMGAMSGKIEDVGGAMYQLAQGMGLGVVRGQDLMAAMNRIHNLGPILAKELGVSVGEIKKLGSEGKLTADVVFTAINKATGKINQDFAKIPKTFAQAMHGIHDESVILSSTLSKAFNLKPAFMAVAQTVTDLMARIDHALKEGGDGMRGWKIIINAVGEAFNILGASLQIIIVLIVEFVDAIGTAIAVLQQLSTGSLKGAADALKGFGERMSDNFKDLKKNIGAQGEAMRKGEEHVASYTDKVGEAHKKESKLAEEAAKKWESFTKGIQGAIAVVDELPAKLGYVKKALDEAITSGHTEQAAILREELKKLEASTPFGKIKAEAEAALNPFQVLIDKTQTLDDAFKAHAITAEEYSKAMEKISADAKSLAEAQNALSTDPMERMTAQIGKMSEEATKSAENLNALKIMLEQDPDNKFIQKAIDQLQDLRTDAEKVGDKITESLAQNAGNAVNSFIDSIGTAKFSFSDFATSMLKDIAKMIFQLMVMKPLMDSISKGLSSGGAGGGMMGMLGGLFGRNAVGNAFPGGTGLPYGIYDRPTFFGMGPTIQKFAKGGVLGEAGPEAIMPLRRSGDGKLGVSAAPTTINVINNAGVEVSTAEKSNDDGSKQIDIMIERKVKDLFGNGGMDKQMKSAYGLTRSAT